MVNLFHFLIVINGSTFSNLFDNIVIERKYNRYLIIFYIFNSEKVLSVFLNLMGPR